MSLFDKKTQDFTESYNTYFSLVFSIIYAKVYDTDIAKDLTQEVFIRFYEKLDEIENHRKWLLGALRFVLMEFFRKKKKDDTIDIEEIFEDVNCTFVNGFRDTRLIIESVLEDADCFGDEKNKVLFDLIAVYNFSYKEAGIQLGLTERQVQYKYQMLLKRIMQELHDRGIKSIEELL